MAKHTDRRQRERIGIDPDATQGDQCGAHGFTLILNCAESADADDTDAAYGRPDHDERSTSGPFDQVERAQDAEQQKSVDDQVDGKGIFEADDLEKVAEQTNRPRSVSFKRNRWETKKRSQLTWRNLEQAGCRQSSVKASISYRCIVPYGHVESHLTCMHKGKDEINILLRLTPLSTRNHWLVLLPSPSRTLSDSTISRCSTRYSCSRSYPSTFPMRKRKLFFALS